MKIWTRVEPDTTWPYPCKDMDDLEWRLRYQDVTSEIDALAAASVISAYQRLVSLPEKRRRVVIRELRAAKERQRPKTGDTKPE